MPEVVEPDRRQGRSRQFRAEIRPDGPRVERLAGGADEDQVVGVRRLLAAQLLVDPRLAVGA